MSMAVFRDSLAGMNPNLLEVMIATGHSAHTNLPGCTTGSEELQLIWILTVLHARSKMRFSFKIEKGREREKKEISDNFTNI